MGVPVVRQLLADGFSVRGLVRNPEKALEGCDDINLSAPWQAKLHLAQDITALLVRQERKQAHISLVCAPTIIVFLVLNGRCNRWAWCFLVIVLAALAVLSITDQVG